MSGLIEPRTTEPGTRGHRGRQTWLAAVGLVTGALFLAACGSNLSQKELAAAQGAITLEAGGAAPAGGTQAASDVPSDSPASAAVATTAQAPAAAVGTGAAKSVGAPVAGKVPSVAKGSAPVAAVGSKASGQEPVAAAAVADTGPKSPIVFCSFGNASGVLGAVSGPAPAANAAWAQYINAKGGLAGHPVKMIIADDGGNASSAQAIAQQCVEQQHAVAVFNEFTFGELDGALPYLKSKGVPVIGTIGAALSSDHSGMVFNPMNGADVGQAWGFIDTILAQSPARKLGILYCQEAATCAQQVSSFSKLLPYQGASIVYKAQVSLVQPDYTAQLLQAKAAGADVIVALADSASLARMARNAKQQNYSPQFAGTYNLAIQATLDQGAALENLILASRTPSYSSSPLFADYRDAMAKYQPGKPMGDVGSGAFVTGGLLAKYASKYLDKPTVTSADFLDLLYGIHGEKLGGLLPGITFPHGDDHTVVNQCIAPVRLVHGRFAESGGFACAPSWKPGA